MNKQIFTVALLAGLLASVITLPARDNRRSNTRQPTVEDRLDQLEQNLADLQERVKRLEEGQQPSRGPSPPTQPSGSNQRTRERTQSAGEQQSFDVFYQGLQSGGHWFNDPTYGDIWQPDVASSDADWRPYSDGHWAYTDQGWTWISNEDFGWATYHYGRWVRRSDTGWAWVPGSRWAPAWVSWREGNDDVGWAPLPPEVKDDSQVRIEGWVDNYYDIGPTAYLFVKVTDLSRPSYRDVLLPPQSNVEFFTRTRNVTQIVYNNDLVAVNGPRYEQIATQAKIPSYKLNYVTANEGRFGFNTKGDQLEVIAPTAKLQTTASVQPKVEKTLGQAEVDRGWQEIDKQKAAQLKQAIQQQAPIPANLPPKPAVAKPATANPQNPPAQTSQQQPAAGNPPAQTSQQQPAAGNPPAQTGQQQPAAAGNPPAPQSSPQHQKGTATQQPAGQPPRTETSPAEGGRMASPTPEKARPTGRSAREEANAPREETRQPGDKPAPSPAEESKGRAPATEQAPRREQKATEQHREQSATERKAETSSRPESQREQPARKEEPVRKEESAPGREELPVREEKSSEPRQRPDAERRVEEKQPGRQSTESSRTEKKGPKQEKSKQEE